MNDLNQFAQGYRQEAEERLSEMEDAVLDVEQRPEDPEAIDRLFRAVHTIKGSGAMFGFDRIAEFAHHVENALQKARDGELPITQELIGIILAARDRMKAMLDEPADAPEADPQAQQIVDSLNALLGETAPVPALQASQPAEAPDTQAADDDGKGRMMTYQIRFRPPGRIFQTGLDPALLIQELRALGECSATALTDRIPPLADMDAETCYFSWDIVLTSDCGLNAVKDVFIFVEDESDIDIQPLTQGTPFADDPASARLGDILIARGDTTPSRIDQALSRQKKLGQLLVEAGEVSADRLKSALEVQKTLRRQTETRKASTVRVAAEKLDVLINLVGELVMNQDRLVQAASSLEDPKLADPVEQIGRLTSELRDCALELRMLPIGTTFRKFKRLVRDLCAELGKDIDLVTEGADTELDKTVIERLGDPLVHLIRNAVDHGLESPEERIKLGKPPRGTLRLAATHREGNVIITIQDDGRGLDPDAIRAKALEKGLIEDRVHLSDADLFDLIFTPGFSTATKVSNVSGRGVGMDVVRRNIEALRGTIALSSEKGRGTTVTLCLPLTLAIIDSFLVLVQGRRFVLPLTLVEECVELTARDIQRVHGQHLVPIRGSWVPYVRLRDLFCIPQDRPPIEQIVVLNTEDQRLGIAVDEIIGVHQAVIKSLGKLCQHVEGLAGATIMGDGSVALIVDVPGLIRTASRQQQTIWNTEGLSWNKPVQTPIST
ncbi:MAG: chemotaxis protein CheA [Deltaproteobacteria bacterium]|nr:chemotaxis protein CheA [Deltaproteobacteria bacterium]